MTLEEAIKWCEDKHITINFFANSHVEISDGWNNVSETGLLEAITELKRLDSL